MKCEGADLSYKNIYGGEEERKLQRQWTNSRIALTLRNWGEQWRSRYAQGVAAANPITYRVGHNLLKGGSCQFSLMRFKV